MPVFFITQVLNSLHKFWGRSFNSPFSLYRFNEYSNYIWDLVSQSMYGFNVIEWYMHETGDQGENPQ